MASEKRSADVSRRTKETDISVSLTVDGTGRADMSTGMTTLAADLGSFNNIPTADVLDSMNSAFRGEYDAVQQTMIAKKCAKVPRTAAAPASAASAAAPQNTASAPEAPALPSAPLPATNDATKR